MCKIISILGSQVYNYQTFSKGETLIESNSYLIKTPNLNILIDAGSKEIFKVLREHNINSLDEILLTHGHADHIKQLHELGKRYQCKVFLHLKDQDLLTDSDLNGSKLVNKTKITAEEFDPVFLSDSKILQFDTISLKVIHVPGHTHGSLMYYSQELGVLFTGDMILGNAIGSTRVPTGNKKERAASLKKVKEFLAGLPDTTTIYPGHGECISLGELKKMNILFKTE